MENSDCNAILSQKKIVRLPDATVGLPGLPSLDVFFNIPFSGIGLVLVCIVVLKKCAVSKVSSNHWAIIPSFPSATMAQY